MDIENRTIWQQAAGDTDRNYVEICLSWDVILNGPATHGSFVDCAANYESILKKKKYTDLGLHNRMLCDTPNRILTDTPNRTNSHGDSHVM